MDTIEVGSSIAGRYRLEGRLDEGGTAQVWRATDPELGREVAVKILVTPPGTADTFVESFREEAQIEAKLKHPNIVEVFDWGHDGDANYIVMELLEGRTVREISNAQGRHDPTLVRDVGRQAASALAYAHGQGMAHGSVSDRTIVVAPDGHATLIGFGLWCRGLCEQPPTSDADTYALGSAMYEMLTGAAPFGPRPPQVAADRAWPEHPHALDPNVPQELDRIVMKAISADPTQRYRTAAQMEADLDALARPKSRTGLWVALAVLAVILAVAATVFALMLQSPVVPDVTGKTQSEAQAVLSAAGLRMVVAGQVASNDVSAGLVTSESPAAGAKVRRRTEISVYLSSGKPSVQVPSVTGTTLDAASAAISGAGLVVGGVTNQASATFPSGTVVSQDPAGGQSATQGDTVNLVVSSGQQTATVPNVIGATQSDATNSLTNLGFKVTVGSAFSSQTNGTVVSQSPSAASVVAQGSTVSITVSKGTAPVAVPNVVGSTNADATSALTQAGFVVKSSEASSTDVGAGDVISQSPAAGSKATPGSQVSIVVSKGP